MKSITETLKSLIASHGEDIIQQPQRLKAMLADLLPNEKRMRYLLDLSLQAEIPKKLKAIQNETSSVWDAKIISIKHYFKEEYFLEDKPIKMIFDCWVEVIPRKEKIEEELNKNEILIEKKGNKIVYDADVIDIDGNIYKTVRIGDQIWMAENLKVSRYSNRDEIQNIKVGQVGPFGYYYYKLESSENLFNLTFDTIYGKLYRNRRSFYGSIAPKGWHIPSAEEWNTLIRYCQYDSFKDLDEKGFLNSDINNKGTLLGGTINGSGLSFFLSGVNRISRWWDRYDNIIEYSDNKLAIKKDTIGIQCCYIRCIKDNDEYIEMMKRSLVEPTRLQSIFMAMSKKK